MKVELEALEKLMRAHLDAHSELLAVMNRKREAIAAARIEAVNELVKYERTIVRQMSDIERHRLAMTRKITRMLKADAQESLSMSEIAAAIADNEMRERLLGLTQELRSAVLQVRERSSVIRAAAESLAQHMAGVMQTVHSALSRAGVYGNKGRVALGTQLDFNIDIKS